VDLLAELGGGGIVAIEVKASFAPTPDGTRRLAVLRDRMGESFVAGCCPLLSGSQGPGLQDTPSA